MREPQGSGAAGTLVALQHGPDMPNMVSSTTVPQSLSAPLAAHEIRRIIYGLMMAMLLGALDQTIVATALPTIGRDLGGAAHLPWVVTAYLLAATSAVPIYGKLSDIHGRRVVLLAAIAIFAIGSILCALAPDMAALVAARFVQGIGGGGLLALSQTIVGDMLTPRERAGWQVYFATAFTTASVAGPVLGGFFAQHLAWQMIFWINVPLSAAAYLMTAAPLKRLPRHERPHKLDLLGAFLLVASTSTLLVALSWAGARFGWLDPRTVTVLAASGLLFTGFSIRLKHSAEPLIPLDILSNKVVLFATTAAALSVGLFLGLAIYAPILFETLRGLSASASGVALLPLTVGTVAGTLMSGRAMATRQHYKRLPLAAMPCAVVAALVLAATAGTMPVWGVSLVLALVSIALGTLLPISRVDPERRRSPPAGDGNRDGQSLPPARRGGGRRDLRRRPARHARPGGRYAVASRSGRAACQVQDRLHSRRRGRRRRLRGDAADGGAATRRPRSRRCRCPVCSRRVIVPRPRHRRIDAEIKPRTAPAFQRPRMSRSNARTRFGEGRVDPFLRR